MTARPAQVFTIDPDRAFVDALARGLLHRAGGAPQVLADMTVLLPTRRACRALADAFLRQSAGAALLLPRLMPLGDVDEDALYFGEGGGLSDGGANNGETAFAIPPAVSGLKRQMRLMNLIAHAMPDATADQTARLAGELARLLDQVQTERLDFAALETLVPETYARHWQETLTFLTIVTRHWPDILAEEEDAVDPARRRDLLITAQAEAWAKTPPAGPVIAAGSTGSIPATADLLKTIAHLPQGCVVLPGLDQTVAARWQKDLDPGHPQFGLYRLLEHMGLAPEDVQPWPDPDRNGDRDEGDTPAPRRARIQMINQALAPAPATAHWADAAGLPPHTLDGLTRIDSAHPEEEARVIALVLRQALETPGKTAALITPDRGLARRVATELKRFGVEIDDSAGTPLDQTPPGTFLRLVARMVENGFDPVSTLACLKHPLAAGGMAPARFRRAVRMLERHVLRGARPSPGVGGIKRALGFWIVGEKQREGGPRHADAVAIAEGDILPALDRLAEAAAAMTQALHKDTVPLADLLRAHVQLCEHLAADDAGAGAARLWAGDAGEAAATLIAELADAGRILAPVPGRSFAALLDQFMAGHAVRPRFGRHPRLHIWGLMEARLQHADVMVLGGLNEGSWPPEAPPSPWMSRPMLAAFGLSLPERRIGLAAHDFTQAFGAAELFLTRSVRVEGAPTRPARWLVRLDTLLKHNPAIGTPHTDRAQPWLAAQALLDAPAHTTPAAPPAPKPPATARPRQLSVTQIETWMRDPYAIYARHILGLSALDPLDDDPSAATYGTFIHDALDAFTRAHPTNLPEDAYDQLIDLGRRQFAAFIDRPGVWAFWWPRFERIARWFVEAEQAHRPHIVRVFSEVTGHMAIDAPGGPFTLTAKADRIERRQDGTLALIDYKTGAAPGAREVKAGFAPQLPLEAAMARAGAFADVPAGAITALEYWRLKGGDPAGEISPAQGKGRDAADPETLADEALQGLTELVARYDLEDTPYPARPRPDMAPRYSDYEHLARVAEWASQDGGDE